MAESDDNLGKKKSGVPLWVWIVGGTVVVAGAYFFLKNRNSSSANAANQQQSTAVPTDNPAGLSTQQYESLLAQLRDIQSSEQNEPNPTPGGGTGGTTLKPFGPGEVLQEDYLLSPPNTMSAVAKKYGISEAHLRQDNPSIQGNPTKPTVIEVPYLTRPGDTPASIAQQFGISLAHEQQELAKQGIQG